MQVKIGEKAANRARRDALKVLNGLSPKEMANNLFRGRR